MWPFFFSSMVESVIPPPAGIVIYDGGTDEPSAWVAIGGVLIYNGTEVSTYDAATITELNVTEGAADGDLDISQLSALEVLAVDNNSFNSWNLQNDTVIGMSLNMATAIPIDIDCASLQDLAIGLSYAEAVTSITFTNAPNLQQVNINAVPAVSSLDFSNYSLLTSIILTNLGNLTTVDITNVTNLNSLVIVGCVLETLTTSATYASCVQVILSQNAFFNDFDITKFPNIDTLQLSNTALTSIGTIPANIIDLQLQATDLEQSTLDQILADLITNGLSNGSVNLQVNGSVQPTEGVGRIDGVWTLTVTGVPVGSFQLSGQAETIGGTIFGVDIDVSSADINIIAENIKFYINDLALLGWSATRVNGVVTVTVSNENEYPLDAGTDSATNFTIANTSIGTTSYITRLIANGWEVTTNF